MKKESETQIQAVRIYSDDIGKNFVKEKRFMLRMKRRKRQITEGTELPNQGKN